MIDRETLIRAVRALAPASSWGVNEVLIALDRAGYEVVLKAAPLAKDREGPVATSWPTFEQIEAKCDAASRKGAAMALRAVARTAPTVEQEGLLRYEADKIERGER